jgi:DNA-binding response OmpR family regulator
MVVDDDLDYVNTMTLLLRGWGHEACFAINGQSALAEARHFRPEIVFLDVGLPDGDGRRLAGELRRESGNERTQIYCVTGRVEEEHSKTIEAGCDDHFLKPLHPTLVLRLLGKNPSLGAKIWKWMDARRSTYVQKEMSGGRVPPDAIDDS